MSGQHQRDNGYSTSNHDRNHACVPVAQRLLLQSHLMLLFPLLFAATLAAAFAVTLSHVPVVDAAPVRAPGSTHAVAVFFDDGY